MHGPGPSSIALRTGRLYVSYRFPIRGSMLSRPHALSAGFIAPCLPINAPQPPSGEQWLHEIKHDGCARSPALSMGRRFHVGTMGSRRSIASDNRLNGHPSPFTSRAPLTERRQSPVGCRSYGRVDFHVEPPPFFGNERRAVLVVS
jgi:hypothetical protein